MEQPKNPVTIYHVAKAAGVAPSTVSRTFARPGRVNADTAERVRRAAEELGYRANQIRQGPPTRRTKLLGVLVSDVSNPFYSQLIRGTQQAANELGYEIVLSDSRESPTRERAALERLIPVVEGFVIGSSRMPDSALRTIAKQRPMVSVNRALVDVPSVISDNPGGARKALELLHELGHEEVYYVAGPEASWQDGVRFRELRDRGPELGMAVHRIGPVLPTFEGGLSVSRTLAERHASAVIGFNDLVAVGVLHGLIRSGVSVPDQGQRDRLRRHPHLTPGAAAAHHCRRATSADGCHLGQQPGRPAQRGASAGFHATGHAGAAAGARVDRSAAFQTGLAGPGYRCDAGGHEARRGGSGCRQPELAARRYVCRSTNPRSLPGRTAPAGARFPGPAGKPIAATLCNDAR